MTRDPTVWGIHMGAHVGDRPVEDSYVALGWQEMGDLSALPADRDAFKAAIARVYPDKKPGAIPVDAGTTFKFVHDIKAGDYVVYPSKTDRMVNIGRLTGAFEYVEGDRDDYPK